MPTRKITEDVQFDPTDEGTLRPKAKPICYAGDHFQPLECPQFDHHVNLPPHVHPDDAFGIFKLFFSQSIMEQLVQHTNAYVRTPKDPSKPRSRAYNWTDNTTVEELYIYLGIQIYMGIHIETRVCDYWNTSPFTPFHPITKYMSLERYQELHIRFRAANPEATQIWDRASILSTPINGNQS